MKAFVITALIFLAAIATHGQTNTIRWEENQALQWADFTGKVNDTSSFDAVCFAQVCYNYKFYDRLHFEFEVYANFDKSTSWKKGGIRSKALLKHEQLHFDIAQIFANKMKQVFENFYYTDNFHEEILQLFDKKKQEYKLMQYQYDEETCHSLDKKKQNEWEEYITDEIASTKLKFQLAKTSEKYKKEGR